MIRGRLRIERARVGVNREVGQRVPESGFPCELPLSPPASVGKEENRSAYHYDAMQLHESGSRKTRNV